jgi:hypothetical protein
MKTRDSVLTVDLATGKEVVTAHNALSRAEKRMLVTKRKKSITKSNIDKVALRWASA